MFRIQEIIESTKAELLNGSKDIRISGVSIDSRTFNKEQLFISIKGEHFDGHEFINQVIKGGAKALLISRPRFLNKNLIKRHKIAVIKSADTIKSLGDLAFYHRNKFSLPVIAITGSNGKTTTKEMLAHILSRKYRILKNKTSYNNFIGLPLTLLKLNKRHRLAVVELGANHFGEITRLSQIAQPQVAIITNIGNSHLEFFKNRHGVFKAKCELIKNLKKPAHLIINADDDFLKTLIRKNKSYKVLTFGIKNNAGFRAQNLSFDKGSASFDLNNKKIKLPLLGMGNIYNALASIAAGRLFDLTYSDICKQLDSFKTPEMRMRLRNFGSLRLIDDCYNANPSSMQEAVGVLERINQGRRKVLICGDMLELGNRACKLHFNVGKTIAKSSVDLLITVGKLSRYTAQGAKQNGMKASCVFWFSDILKLQKVLSSLIRPKDLVLVKGSRRVKMERIIKCFTTYFID